MKRIIIGTLVLVLCLGMSSCKKEKDSSEVRLEEEQAAAYKAATEKWDLAFKQLSDLVAKAKAEGDKWSVDEWKEAYKNKFLIYSKPISALKHINEKIDSLDKADDPSTLEHLDLLNHKVAELDAQIDFQKKHLDDMEALEQEFTDITNNFKNGKAVLEDKEWISQLEQEVGVTVKEWSKEIFLLGEE